MTYSDFFVFALAGLWATIVLFKAGIYFAPQIGLVDKPGGRKTHEGAIPLIGGLVIVPVFAGLCYLTNLSDMLTLSPLFGGVALLLIMGAIDDKFHIHPWARFVIQIWLACYIVVFCQVDLENLGNLYGFGDVHLGWFGKIFAAVCLVLLMNAINMLDGVDGLAAGFIAVVAGWLMVAAYQSGADLYLKALIFFMIPIIGFLIFNARHPWRKKASVFLGDAGSLSLALIIGWFAIQMAKMNEPVDIFPAVTIIWIMTVPIMDTFAIFFTRKKQGRSPFDADRLHLHYKLIDAGYTPSQATWIILAIALVTGGIGYLGSHVGVPEYVLLYSWSAILLGYTYYRIKLDA